MKLTERAELVRNYFTLARDHGAALEALALRTESSALREVLAYGATEGRLNVTDLEVAVERGSRVDLRPIWAGRLARVLALQNYEPRDRASALALFRRIESQLDSSRFVPLRLLQVYIETLIAE